MSGWFDRNRARYGDDWDAIAAEVKDANLRCCEACGHPHGPPPYVLTVDHLDGVPEHMDRENLMALCQSCHLLRQGLTRGGKLVPDASRITIAIALLTYRAQRQPPANILRGMATVDAGDREWDRFYQATGQHLLDGIDAALEAARG